MRWSAEALQITFTLNYPFIIVSQLTMDKSVRDTDFGLNLGTFIVCFGGITTPSNFVISTLA